MAIISRTLAVIKSNPLATLGGAERVNQSFADAGHVWRDRVLTAARTMKLFILVRAAMTSAAERQGIDDAIHVWLRDFLVEFHLSQKRMILESAIIFNSQMSWTTHG